jgi:cardiolipin synthase A/B
MKPFISVLTLVFSVFIFSSKSLADARWISQIHPLNDAVLVATPEDQHQAIIKVIQSSQKSIIMWMYHLTDPAIIQSMIQAAQKGVDVQVILDHDSLTNAKYKTIFEQLSQGKVSVIASSPQFRITHIKSFIVDSNTAFISTMNLVGHYQQMRDFGIFTQDQAIIRELLQVFRADLDNAKNNTKLTPLLTNPNLIWSPVNAEQKLAELIDSAKSSILLSVENLGKATPITAALTRALERKVKVRVLVPECDLNPNPYFNFPALYELAAGGAESRIATSPSTPNNPYVHAKTIILDNRLMFLGSENFSYSSLNLSRELGVVLANPKTIFQLKDYFEKDWRVARPLPPTTPNSCPKMNILEQLFY